MATRKHHIITWQTPLNMSLTQPTFNKDTLQSLHNSTPTSMFGTLGGNNHRGGWYIHFALPSTSCNIGEPLHLRRKRYLASSLTSEGPWRLSNFPCSVEIRLHQIIIKLLPHGVCFLVNDSLHLYTHTCQTVRPTTKNQASCTVPVCRLNLLELHVEMFHSPPLKKGYFHSTHETMQPI